MKLPLHEIHEHAGVAWTGAPKRQVPAHYGDPAAEYRSALESAVLFDRSDASKVELAGPDAKSFLHNLCTNDIKNLPVGGGCEAFLTTAKARVVAHVFVGSYQRQDDSVLWLDTVAGQGEAIRGHLDRYVISEQVEVTDRSEALALLTLVGPRAEAIVASVLGADLRSLPSLHNRPVPRGHVRRNELLGLDGYDLFCDRGEAAALWRELTGAGARPAGRQTYEVLRVEAGLPEFGPDIDAERLAMEVGRTAAISYAKGCYLGQETIVMARDRGQVNRTLMGVTVPGEQVVPAGTKLFHGDAEAGHVTSAVLSPRLGKVAALAYLRRGCQAVGTELLTEPTSAGRWASVTALPFVPPSLAAR